MPHHIHRHTSRPLSWRAAALVACVPMALAACDRADQPVPMPPLPEVSAKAPPADEVRTVTGGLASDPSVPAAESSLTPAPKADAPTSGPDTTMTPHESAEKMPLPGQANDHSNPDKRVDDALDGAAKK